MRMMIVAWYKIKMWRFFNKQSWTIDEVLDKTIWLSGSLSEAVGYLTFWLMDNYGGINNKDVRNFAKKLVLKGFDRDWK